MHGARWSEAAVELEEDFHTLHWYHYPRIEGKSVVYLSAPIRRLHSEPWGLSILGSPCLTPGPPHHSSALLSDDDR